MNDSQQYRGSCLCGAVRFTLDGEFDRFYLCHCSHCRKDTGSAHAANLFASKARIEWLSGQDKVHSYNLQGTRHTRSFCSVCGSAVPTVTPKMTVVPAGCLDTDVSQTPDAHIFAVSRASWDHELHTIPVFDKYPS